MIVLTWNVACGRGTRAAVDLADQLAADVVLLQEASIEERWSGQVSRTQVQQRPWGSAVLVGTGMLDTIAIPGYSGWVVGARWFRGAAGSSEALYLFSVHSPTPSEQEPRGPYVAESVQIVRTICAAVPVGARLIVGGDFNFRSFGERLPTELPVNDRAESEALREFRDLGFLVGWRDTHPGLPLPQTLRWNGGTVTPYHCDGFLFRGIDVATAQCEVLSSEFVTRHSDHNPLVSWVRVGSA